MAHQYKKEQNIKHKTIGKSGDDGGLVSSTSYFRATDGRHVNEIRGQIL